MSTCTILRMACLDYFGHSADSEGTTSERVAKEAVWKTSPQTRVRRSELVLAQSQAFLISPCPQ
jgi:hypothetical protein